MTSGPALALPDALAANEGILATGALFGFGLVVLSLFALLMKSSGTSLRPILFVAGLFLPLTALFVVIQLVVARAPAPPRTDGLAVSDGRFGDRERLFGTDAPAAWVSDAKSGLPGILDEAEVAEAGVFPDGTTVLVAQFAEEGQAQRAAAAYHRAFQLTGTSGDEAGGWRATRMQGDFIEMLLSGRCLFLWTGLTKEDRAARRAASDLSGYLPAPEVARGSPLFPALQPLERAFESWPMQVGGILLCVALYTWWFFRGASWASAVEPAAGTPPATIDELEARLLALNNPDLPFAITKGHAPHEFFADWCYANAKWIDLAGAHGLKRTFRIRLTLHQGARAVRATDYTADFDWSAGGGGAALAWRAVTGIVFFQRESHTVLGLRFDEGGRTSPEPGYTYRFDLGEMKSPLIAVVTRSGWSWRPTILQIPSFRRSSTPVAG